VSSSEKALELLSKINLDEKEKKEKDDKEEASGVNFINFLDYISEKDAKSAVIFKSLDNNSDGHITDKEVAEAFEKLGIFLEKKQIDQLIAKLDTNHTLYIDWQEWRDFFRFSAHSSAELMLRQWRNETLTANDEALPIPNDYSKREIQEGIWWRNLVAGGLSGTVSRTCTAPLDRIRIYLQVNGSELSIGIRGAFQNMIKEGGIKSLWRGNMISVLKITPESAIKFGAYEQMKWMMGQEGQTQLPLFQKWICGTFAGFTAQTAIYPLEVLKTRLALRTTGQYSSMGDCVRQIYLKEGMSAFYRGYLMNTLGIAGVGVDLALYETLKQKYRSFYPDNHQPSVPVVIGLANVSSTCAMFSTYPIFLIRYSNFI
jgi:solute carrier family 25 (mitochondrial phosphate transporter), member 23/24/25/41